MTDVSRGGTRSARTIDQGIDSTTLPTVIGGRGPDAGTYAATHDGHEAAEPRGDRRDGAGPGPGDAAGRRHDRRRLGQGAGRRRVELERGHARATCPLDRLAKRAKEGVRDAGGFPFEFVTIAVSDGISMGHEGMRGSLVSREIIADSVECVMHAERFDALVTFAGCDKSLPGMLMAAARLNLPSVFLYGGSILPGHYKDQALDVVSVFEAVGACAAGTLTENELGEIEKRACPTEGSCAGMFTANTMASVGEALGMSLPGSASPPAVDRRRDDFAYESGKAVMHLARAGHPARARS